MPQVLVVGSVIQCTHGGQLKLSAANAQLTVDNNGAVTSGQEVGLMFGSPQAPVAGMVSPCTAQTPTTPPTFVPCTTLPAVAGISVMLTVGNQPVLLATAQGTTVSGAGPGQWSVGSAGQTKLETL